MESETPRTIRIASFVTKEERDKLAATARAAGMSLSTFIRVKILEACRERGKRWPE